MSNQPTDDIEVEIETGDEEQPSTPPTEETTPEIEVVDDTPEEDRGRGVMPPEIVKELEEDELEDYSEKVKQRLKQMKRVWHDERREKEREAREKAEALAAVQRLLEENRRYRSMLSSGEMSLLESHKRAATYEMEMAKQAYREAYEAGDADKMVEAQEKLASATYQLNQIAAYKPTLQEQDGAVEETVQPTQAPQPDPKAIAWQERNSWFGTNPEMTAAALGLHQKLINERGLQFAGTDAYWDAVDKTMRRRFPEYFGEEPEPESRPAPRERKPSNVVAPASRSRSPKKIVLKQSQLAIARQLGLTPEQYARELMKISEN